MFRSPSGALTPVIPPYGALYNDTKAPMAPSPDYAELGSRVGRAMVQHIRDPIFTRMPLLSWGDASVEVAAKAGGITTIRHVDYRLLSILSIYMEFETIVYGD